jgi:hypothetical protein
MMHKINCFGWEGIAQASFLLVMSIQKLHIITGQVTQVAGKISSGPGPYLSRSNYFFGFPLIIKSIPKMFP